MFSKVYSGGLHGIEGYVVQVEADVSGGLPGFHMVGHLASEVREAEERVRTAIYNSGLRVPAAKVTVNLSPANVRKEGTSCDLPIAVAVLAAHGIIKSSNMEEYAFLGELGLDGVIKPVHGVLPMVLALCHGGIRTCFLAAENVPEGMAAEKISIVTATDLKSLILLINNPKLIREEKANKTKGAQDTIYQMDYSEVNGQKLVRRATEVAVAGGHNLIYIGPPGSGKSMMAKRIPTIMPELSREEQLEVSKIYSICGLLPSGKALMKVRPYRAPHHTITSQALAGGGRSPKPGEISLASRGVLFLDELSEFRKQTLEILRQPLEEHTITVARTWGSCQFPANFMLVAAMNPCPCGFFPDRNRCFCTEQQVRRYLGRISRPLIDRIDICVEAHPVTYENIKECGQNEASSVIRARIERAREIQKIRFKNRSILCNSEMGIGDIRTYCKLSKRNNDFLQKIFAELKLSARGCHRILKVARTIADLEGVEVIGRNHLCEAAGYRNLEERYWGKEL